MSKTVFNKVSLPHSSPIFLELQGDQGDLEFRVLHLTLAPPSFPAFPLVLRGLSHRDLHGLLSHQEIRVRQRLQLLPVSRREGEVSHSWEALGESISNKRLPSGQGILFCPPFRVALGVHGACRGAHRRT